MRAALLLAVLLAVPGLPAWRRSPRHGRPGHRPGRPTPRPRPAGRARCPRSPLDEIQRGQHGYGLSVFSGTEPERFDVEVIGVMRNLSPDVSYILARLTGKGLEKSGVAAGMSGSPVFIDGRLAGAVAFSWPFSKEAIAGITPIGSMRQLSGRRRIAGLAAAAAGQALATSSPATSPRTCSPRSLAGSCRSFADGARRRPSSGPPPASASVAGRCCARRWASVVRRRARPAPGTAPDDLTPRRARWTRCWWTATSSWPATAPSPTATATRCSPSATPSWASARPGADGHRRGGDGPVESQYSSFKISNIGKIVGAFEQDRKTGIQGRIGAEAPMIPMVRADPGRAARASTTCGSPAAAGVRPPAGGERHGRRARGGELHDRLRRAST